MPASRSVSVIVASGVRALGEAVATSLSRNDNLTAIATAAPLDSLPKVLLGAARDVAVLCADTPGWDAAAVCARVKERGTAIRVVVVGPDDDGTVLQAAVRSGADGYVVDTEPIEALAEAIIAVHQGQSRVPPSMLGSLLRGLIAFRREDDAVVESFANLGQRERAVLAEVVFGATDQAIASKLYLSPNTVRTHVRNILGKLGVHSRLEATRLVLEHDLLDRFGLDGAAAGGGGEPAAKSATRG